MLKLGITVYDQQRRRLYTRKRESRSYVLQFFQILQAGFSQVNVINVRDTSNVLRTIQSGTVILAISAGVGIDTFGIQVGTGVAAPTPSDFQLGTQILNGALAGQLNYGAEAINAAIVNGAQSEEGTTRAFTNNSGAGITVNEIGLAITARDNGGTDRRFMGIRDVFVPGITIANTQTMTANYTLFAIA